ncbi:hypothetical protein GF356_04165 [candidate division GN15 bacterium]|nr:hypothetical protein [candidate division GN15 bacterium]
MTPIQVLPRRHPEETNLAPRSGHKIEFLICGSPNDAFFSQIAFFRLCLDHLDAVHRSARVVAVFGAEEKPNLPERWRPHFDRIEFVGADPSEFARVGYFAASDLRFDLIDRDADVSFLCDADTALMRQLPGSFLEDSTRHPAVSGVIAHYPFPLQRQSLPARAGSTIPMDTSPRDVWRILGERFLGYDIPCRHNFTLLDASPENRCAFYINYGFVAGTPVILTSLRDQLLGIQDEVADFLGNDFYGQVAIALAVERGGIPSRALPMRFNYPNDREADRRYPEEILQVILMHYLRHEHFNRHTIFASSASFDQFMNLNLTGSDAAFQSHVRAVCQSRYPF